MMMPLWTIIPAVFVGSWVMYMMNLGTTMAYTTKEVWIFNIVVAGIVLLTELIGWFINKTIKEANT